LKILSFSAVFFFVLNLGVVQAQSTELDPKLANVPQELIVRVDPAGNREVFKVTEKLDVQNADSAAVLNEKFATAENKISNLVSESELDRTTSTEAWYYYNWNWYGYNYAYNNYGYNYYYQPYYSYNFSYYSYYYYRWY